MIYFFKEINKNRTGSIDYQIVLYDFRKFEIKFVNNGELKLVLEIYLKNEIMKTNDFFFKSDSLKEIH